MQCCFVPKGLLIFFRLDYVQPEKKPPSFCHVPAEEALLCCLQPGDLMVRKSKNLLCSQYLEND